MLGRRPGLARTWRRRLAAGSVVAVAAIPVPLPLPFPTGEPEGCVFALDRLATRGCQLIASDTTAVRDPVPLWGQIECERRRRHAAIATDGDPHRTGAEVPQGDSAYRRLSVRDGDEFYGERCELGRNDHRPTSRTFALYREGERRVTFVSVRLPKAFPLSGPRWQTVIQMKQAQPSANGGRGPMLEIQARDHRYVLENDWRELWSIPARKNDWTRFALDVRYSQDPTIGAVKLYADLNGDGDARDRRERSPVFRVRTLRRESRGGPPDDGIPPGASIPSHLRVGIYHDRGYRCRPRRGCAIHVDNVQVVGSEHAAVDGAG